MGRARQVWKYFALYNQFFVFLTCIHSFQFCFFPFLSKNLYKAAGYGRNQQNIKRDLLSKLPPPSFSTTLAKLPVKAAFKKEIAITQIVNVPVLLPHEAFQKVWESGSFQRTMCAGPHVLESFWEGISDHPAVRFHPVRKIDGFERRAVPLLLHGDGAAVTQQIGSGSKSCLFLSWKSMVGNSKDTKDAHILIGAIWSHLCVSTSHVNTSKSFWKVVEKSFHFMLNSGGDSTGGFFGCLLFATGDLEYYNSFLGQARWNANFPCPLCNVHLSNVANFRAVTDVSVDQWDSLPRQGQSSQVSMRPK